MSNNTTNKFSLIDLPDVPESLDNAVKNLTDTPTQNAGQTIGDLWYLVFGGISHAADKRRMKYANDLEQYRRELTKTIEQIPEDKKVEPSIQITAQALENSKYCISSQSLREMFVKLISGSMNKDFEPFVHPSFPEMIKQMDDSDAMLLSELKRNGKSAIANFRLVSSKNSGYQLLFTNAYISNIFRIPIEKCARSLTSLERMGLVKLEYDVYFSDETIYSSFKSLDLYKTFTANLEHNVNYSKIDVQKGLCSVTPLGKDFINLCVS